MPPNYKASCQLLRHIPCSQTGRFEPGFIRFPRPASSREALSLNPMGSDHLHHNTRPCRAMAGGGIQGAQL